MTILEMLNEYASREPVRFHMPGHKGQPGYFGAEYLQGDITELSFSDNLMQPEGVIRKAEELHAARTGAAASAFSINGSSAGVVAMILSAVKRGEKIILGRDVHISAVYGLQLSGAEPVFVQMPEWTSYLPQTPAADQIEKCVKEHPDAKAVFVTYPNYAGFCCDLKRIAQIAHQANMALLVDAAHGAHFPYSSLLPADCAECGADAWVTSMHKTLPAMNQTASVQIGKHARIEECDLREKLAMLQTTSPSYLLLASLEYASDYMFRQGEAEIARILGSIEEFSAQVESIDGLHIVGLEDLPASVVDKDPTKVMIDVSARTSGQYAQQYLEEQGIYVEMSDAKHVLLLTSVADQRAAFERTASVLRDLPVDEKTYFKQYRYPIPKQALLPAEAMQRDSMYVPLLEAISFVCAQPAGLYPPGVPLVMPGEIVTEEVVQSFLQAQELGLQLFGVQNGKLRVTDY